MCIESRDAWTCETIVKKGVKTIEQEFRTVAPCEAGCSQEEGPKKGFVMGSRTQGVQEILEKCM